MPTSMLIRESNKISESLNEKSKMDFNFEFIVCEFGWIVKEFKNQMEFKIRCDLRK